MKHVGPISGIATFGERYVATAGYDNQVILWHGRNKQPIYRVFHDHLANQCTFSPDGSLLASASGDYTARLWEVPTLRLKAVFGGHSDDIEMVSFAPDGRRVATCSRDHNIKIFDLAGHEVAHLVGHDSDVISVSWMSDGNQLVSSSDDGTVRRWDATTSCEMARNSFEGVETDTIAVTREGVIFAGDDEGRISTIDGGGVSSVPAHDAGIKRLVFSDAMGLLISLSYDRTLALWKRESGVLTRQHTAALPDIVWPRSCAFFGDTGVALGTFGSTYALYDFATASWNLDGIDESIGFNAVLNAGGHVYTVGDAGVVFEDGKRIQDIGVLCNFLVPLGEHILTGGQAGRVFEARTGRMLHQNRSPLNCGTVFERDGVSHAAIGTYTGEALIFRLAAGGDVEYVTSLKLHDNAVKGVTAAGGLLFSVCATGAAAFHRIDDFACVDRRQHAHDRVANGCVAVRPGVFASVSRDLKLRLWHDGEPAAIESPHRNSIKCISASPDGRYVATGSFVGMVAIYDIEQRRWTTVARPTAAGVSCLAPGGTPGTFLASSYDGRVYTISAMMTTPAAA
jgi:WD40 repeat protein